MDYFFNNTKLYLFRKYEKGFTQEYVASRLGMCRSNYSYIESGKIEPKVSTLCMLCKILECEPVFLLTRGQ